MSRNASSLGLVQDQITLDELAEAAGLPARTIRFYISRGLLNGPAKSGRGAAYTPEHLARLEEIKRLQSGGRTLAEIERVLSGPFPEAAVASPVAWWQHALGDDVIVWVKAGAAPWRIKQVRRALEEFARQVGSAQSQRRDEGDIK